MKFDVNSSPPNADDILFEQQRLENTRRQYIQRGARDCQIISIIILLLYSGLWWFTGGEGTLWWVSLVSVFATSVFASIVIFCLPDSTNLDSTSYHFIGVGLAGLIGFLSLTICDFPNTVHSYGSIASIVVISAIATKATVVTFWRWDKGNIRQINARKALEPIPDENYLYLAEWVKQSEEIKAYCRSVVDKRTITKGEYSAMEEWLKKNERSKQYHANKRRISEARQVVSGCLPPQG